MRDIVLNLAGLFKEEYVPGVVTLALLILLGIAVVSFGLTSGRRWRALVWLRREMETAGDAVSFARSVDDIQHKISQSAKSAPRRSVRDAFDEFRGTCIPALDGANPILCNSIRPGHFFNTEDLGFSVGFWRIVPGLFVTVGLFLHSSA